MSKEKLQTRVLVLSLLVQTLLLVNNTLALADRVSLYRSSMVEGWSRGEELEIHVGLDTGRPRGLLDRVRRLADNWGLDWLVGGQRVQSAFVRLDVTVTGTNVEDTVTLDFYVEAVPQGGQGRPFRFLNGTGETLALGDHGYYHGSWHYLDEHFEKLRLPPTQSWTVDYYVYVRAEATGLVSGEPVVAEIPYTLFDTKTYEYREPETVTLPQVGEFGVAHTHGTKSQNGIDYVRVSSTNQKAYIGTYYSQEYEAFIGFKFRDLPQDVLIKSATLYLRAAATYPWEAHTSFYGSRDLPNIDAVKIDSEEEWWDIFHDSIPDSYARTLGPWTKDQWYQYDITALVRKMRNAGTQNYAQLFIQNPTYVSGDDVGPDTRVYWWGLKSLSDKSMPYIEVVYLPYQASWYPTTLSLADLPLTLDMVALVALMAATVVALRDSREEYRGAMAACTAILAVVILGHGGDAASWYPIPPLSVTLSHLFGLEETPRWFTVGVLSMVALATFETLRRRLS